MKHFRKIGLTVLATALMVFAAMGTASATQLTGAGGVVLGVNTPLHASADQVLELHPPIGTIVCVESTISGKVTNAGSATTTVSGPIEALSFASCNATVHVIQKGSLEIHTETGTSGSLNNNNGTLTSSGTQVTVEYLGFHCIFSTNSTDLGTVTGSATTGAQATLDIKATIPRTAGRSGAFCGSTAAWTGSYSFENPNTLNIH